MSHRFPPFVLGTVVLLAACGSSGGASPADASADTSVDSGATGDDMGVVSPEAANEAANEAATDAGSVSVLEAAPGDVSLVDGAPATADFMVGGSRPVNVHVPPGLSPTKPAPLLIMLHGYSASGDIEEAYLQLQAATDANGMLYAHPDGTPENLPDSGMNRAWNATDGCCALAVSPPPDDVAYIHGLVEEIRTHHDVDPARVYLFGHSNGGFMAHRMACDDAATFAAIVSLAGATWNDFSKCRPSQPVSILDVHGDADMTILYTGGTVMSMLPYQPYPSEATTLADWVGVDGCNPTATTPSGTIATGIPTVPKLWSGCKASTEVELWTLTGAGHIPSFGYPDFANSAVAWLLAHHR
jgi:polyhydroxybutyrate depolymerase